MSAIATGTAAEGFPGKKLATPPDCVTHSFPSGPVVMPVGVVMLGELNSVTTPVRVIWATSAATPSRVTHMLPSGPWVIWLLELTDVTVNVPSTTGSAAAGPEMSGTARAVAPRATKILSAMAVSRP